MPSDGISKCIEMSETILEKQQWRKLTKNGKRDKIVLKKVPSAHNTTLEEHFLELL